MEAILSHSLLSGVSQTSADMMDKLFMSYAQASHLYYATGGQPNTKLDQPPREYIEGQFMDLVPGNQALVSHFYGPLSSTVAQLQGDIQSRASEVVDNLPTLTTEQEADYIYDFARRQSAHEWLAYYDVFSRSDLMFEVRAKREYMEQDEFRKLVLFLSEAGLKVGLTRLFGELGHMTSESLLMAYHAYVNTRSIEQDQHFRDQAIGLMNRAHTAQAFIGSNALAGMDLVEGATLPETPSGDVVSIDLARTTPGVPLTFITRDVYADLQIQNTGDVTADYAIVAYYSVAKGPGSYQQLLEEMNDPVTGDQLSSITLSPGEQDTVRMYFKEHNGDDFGTPKYGVIFVLYAVTDRGVYMLDTESVVPFDPDDETVASAVQAASLVPVSPSAVSAPATLSLGNALSETERYPIWAIVGADTDQFTYTLNIAADNPFPMPLAVLITQTIPNTVSVTGPGDGVISGNEIVWYRVIQPRDTVLLQYAFDYSGDYAAEATLPPVYWSFYSAVDDANVSLNTGSIFFYARSPLRAESAANTAVSPDTQYTIPVTVTNLDNSGTQQGNLSLHVWALDSTGVLSTTTHITLGAGASQGYDLTYTAPGEGLYVLEIVLQYDDETMSVACDLLIVRENRIYLPLVLRSYTPSTGPINSPPNTPFTPSPSDGATDQSVNVNLSWIGGDPDGDSVTYDVYFEAGDSTPDVSLCSDVTSTFCDLGSLDYSTHYYWQVVARDSHGATATGPVWDFTTQDMTLTFIEHPIPDTFDGARSVYATDMDGDGDMDILGAAHLDDAITWWENDGSENFAKRTISGTFDGASSVYAIDIDGDGDTDVLGAADLADAVAWWESTASVTDTALLATTLIAVR